MPLQSLKQVGVQVKRKKGKCMTLPVKSMQRFERHKTMILFNRLFLVEPKQIFKGATIDNLFKPFLAGTIPENPPVTIDQETMVEDPMSLQGWIETNKKEIEEKGHKFLFGKKYQFEVC